MKPKVILYLDHPRCSVQSCHGIIKALSTKFVVDIFQQNQIKDSTFKKYDIIAFPGGIGDSDSFDTTIRPKMDIIKNQITNGKRYLGICMGAFWAGHHYFNILDNIKCEQYIKQPNSDVRRPFSTITPVIWEGKKYDMFFYDGCSLVGDHSKFETIATYINNDPMAIIQNNIGLIGCHPESDEYWYDKPYMKKYWHNFVHHQLLLDFVDKLMKH
jgi:glutamine amidotransferase-like uncharacterized protein